MARAAQPLVMPPSPARTKPAATANKPARAPSPLPKAASVTAAVPKLSKDELRAQVEALERTIARMKAKAKVMRAAARQADDRMTELEAEVTRLRVPLPKPLAGHSPIRCVTPRFVPASSHGSAI